MTISINAAVKNVLSERYNKKNIFYYIMLFCVSTLVIVFISFINPSSENQNPLATISQFSLIQLLSLITSVIAIGIYIVSINNGYRGEESIFANLFKDIKKIAITGIVTYAGIMLMYLGTLLALLLPGLPLGVILFVTYMNIPDKTLMIIPIIICIILFAVYLTFIILLTMGLFFNYTKSLKFEDIINVKKSFNFISSARRELSVYILKSIALIILCIFLFIFIGMIITIVLAGCIKIPSSEQSSFLFALIIIGLCWAMGIIANLVLMDLQIQFLRETAHYMPEPKDDWQEVSADDEYIEINENE
ncbi:hypothetical protein IJ182_08295 [bacterium]|nr:hypothetical protein [bacterium]